MKKRAFVFTSLLVLSLFLSAGVAQTYAFWGGPKMSLDDKVATQQKMFEEKAKILGVSSEEIKNAWANGQNIKDFAKAKGIGEAELKAKMQSYKLDQMKIELKALVDKGVITQAQMDARLKFLTEKESKMMGQMNKMKNKQKFHFPW